MGELLELEEGYGKFVCALSNMLEDYEDRIKALEEWGRHPTPLCFTQADLDAAVKAERERIWDGVREHLFYPGSPVKGLVIDDADICRVIDNKGD